MKKLFRGFLTIVFLTLSLNTCYAMDANNKQYVNKNISVVNNLYNSLDNQNSNFNFAIENSKKASSLQQLKSLLKTSMENREPSIVINYRGMDCYNGNNVDIHKIKDIIEKTLDEDHYLKYSIKEYNIKVSGYYGDIIIKFDFQYLTTKNQEEYVDRKVESILSEIITDDMNDYAKEKAIHDYIVRNVQYDTSLQEHSAYSALAKGKAVCQGYSLLMLKMLQKVGIKSIIVESIPMNHAWNMVYIDNKWYHVDVTWDEQVSDLPNRIAYDYYNLTDDEISKNIKGNRHIWDMEEYPSAIHPYDSSLLKKEFANIKLKISNNIMFNIKLNKKVDIKKVDLFDKDKLLESTNNVNGNTVTMDYKGDLEEKPYKLKITLADGTTCFSSVTIYPTSEVIEIDNKNKLVKVKALIDGQLSINGKLSGKVKKGEILTVYKDQTLVVVPSMSK
ncbi:transglutaminase domain-containing protein [Clostridium cochlearium]|uniref:transglutaminase domain-containing protein n=1 Tax=Clostridium cochlearium TaxID=1494 RepID=UPI0022E09E19|nr:transglutaminase domain-containing protein [Clostridium cochlearium]